MTEPTDAPDADEPFGTTDPLDAIPQAAGSGASEPTARHTARLRATELRAAQRKTDRRRRWIVRGSIALAIVLAVAAVVVTLVTVTRPNARGPENMASDGIVIGKSLKAERTSALAADEDPVATSAKKGVVRIRLYIDFFQPDSAAFFRANDAQLRKWLNSGAATLEIHPIAIATTGTDGTQYSQRAANAAGCVAEHSPDSFYAFTKALLAKQPDPKSSGLDTAAIEKVVASAGVTSRDDVDRCIENQRFARWVQAATARATAGPLPDTKVKNVSATPTVLLDGEQFAYSDPANARELARAFVTAVGGTFSDDQSASPSPTPSPTASP